MYKVEFAHSAFKEMERIYKRDKSLYTRLLTVIKSLAQDPFQGKKLKGNLKGDFSIRVGQYRVIYTIVKERLMVVIIDLGHRRDIYQ